VGAKTRTKKLKGSIEKRKLDLNLTTKMEEIHSERSQRGHCSWRKNEQEGGQKNLKKRVKRGGKPKQSSPRSQVKENGALTKKIEMLDKGGAKPCR